MSSALAACALILGGWTLPELGESLSPPGQDDLLRPPVNPGAPGKILPKIQSPASPLRPGMNPRGVSGRQGGLGPGDPRNLPFSPTDPMAGMSPMMPLLPTDAQGSLRTPLSGGGLRSPMGTGMSPGGQRLPYPPSGLPQAPLNRGPVGFAQPSSVPMQETPKPFESFRHASGVSPWMNLYRPGGATADNYTSLVRPQLDQRALNQRVSGDIGNLQTTTQRQGQQINQDQQILQGTVNQGSVINYQYYPGMGQ
jgi:hypothetical protein